MQYNTIIIDDSQSLPLLEPYNPIKGQWLLRWRSLTKGEWIECVIDHKPSIEDIKSYVLAWHDEQIDHKRQYGFLWKGISVELTAENKANYKDAYDFAKDDHADGTYKTTTLKFGSMLVPEFYAFETFEELKEFSVSAKTYVERVYAVGWARKARIDWSVYDKALQDYG